MNSFFKKALIGLLVIVLAPVIALFAYLAWMKWQDDEVSFLSLKCLRENEEDPLRFRNDSGQFRYFYISKERKSENPQYVSFMNAKSVDTDELVDFDGNLFVRLFSFSKFTATHANFQIIENLGAKDDYLFKINRETLAVALSKNDEEMWRFENCEEISKREIFQIARKHFTSATKDRKF